MWGVFCRKSQLLVKIVGNFFILFGVTGNSSCCNDTDVKVNIGNTAETNKNDWLVLQVLNEKIVLHSVFSLQDSNMIFPVQEWQW